MSKAKAKPRSNSGQFGDWNRLNVTMQANSADLPHLEKSRARLEELSNLGLSLIKEQGALRASKQEKSKELKAVLEEGSQLATFLRIALKQHYGRKAEKLAEFGLQPFRGRNVKPQPEPEPEGRPTPAGSTSR
jgi:hypothetical protein